METSKQEGSSWTAWTTLKSRKWTRGTYHACTVVYSQISISSPSYLRLPVVAKVDHRPQQSASMLSRRLVTRFSPLRTLGRASSTAASVPSPLAPTSESSVAQQSPNYPTTWSTTQKPRPVSHSGPRFEQTFMELQPNPLSAMELVANEPIRVVHGRKAVCDGGE